MLHEYGLLGENILNSGFTSISGIKEGAGAFVCGEETALIASIEGRRGMPRSRPPYPASSGLYGSPTNINNVETLATVPTIFREGGKLVCRHRYREKQRHQNLCSGRQGTQDRT